MNCRYPRPEAKIRLLCFPWAGGGASFYTAWGRDITQDVEVHSMCLPGRENRFKESCERGLKETLNEIVDIIHKDHLDKPFIFFGHSMGALLAFLVALELKSLYNTEPLRMFLSGSFSPQSSKRKERVRNIKLLTDQEFCEKLKSFGGTPKELLENQELLKIFLPPLRSDFSMLEDIQYDCTTDVSPPLNCPIDFFDGSTDMAHDAEEWQELTSGSFQFQTLPGGHFYLKDPVNMKIIINHINQRCANFNTTV